MRLLFLILISMSFLLGNAQSPMYFNGMNAVQKMPNFYHTHLGDSSSLNKKWSLIPSVGIYSGFTFYNGGGSSVLSVPVGLQLNRRINNNLYAFAEVSVAPAYFNLNQSYQNNRFNNSYPLNSMLTPNGLGINSRLALGLMYVNDDKTFSISGSIRVDREYYPTNPYNRTNTKSQQSVPVVR